jgi:hypothetical protein
MTKVIKTVNLTGDRSPDYEKRAKEKNIVRAVSMDL